MKNMRFQIEQKDITYPINLQETAAASPNTVLIDGKNYRLLGNDEQIQWIREQIPQFSHHENISLVDLEERLITIGAHDISIRDQVHEIGVSTLLPNNVSATGRVAAASKKTDTNAWVAIDQAYLRLIAQKYLEKVKKTTDSTGLKDFLFQRMYEVSSIKNFQQKFDEAFEKKDVELFLPLLEHACEEDLTFIIDIEKLDIPIRQNEPLNNFIFTQDSLRALDAYIHDPAVGFSGAITLQDTKGIPHTIASDGIDPATPFAMHSIGKVFTGMLAIKLIQEGKKISKKMLDEHIQLDQSVLALLPITVQRHLSEKKTTLHQVMLHQGGLGDYMGKQTAAITQAILSGTEPPKMEKPEDFLSFAEEETFPLDEEHYSNLGLLLVGLSLQYHTETPFNDLLQTYIIEPAGISSFSSQKPDGARVNSSDPTAEYICGSPAGGYWTTAEDLCKFGSWIASQCKKDPDFLKLVRRYGKEFYSEGEIHHSGGITSASAYLSVFPEQEVVISILSDKKRPSAKKMNDAIRNHILHKA